MPIKETLDNELVNNYDDANQPKIKTIVYGGGFVLMDNELALYNLLGYADDPTIQVSPITLDIYRRLKQHRNNDEAHPLFGKSWVSMERLAVEMVINRKTISKHLRILEKVGLINIRRFYRGGRKHSEFSFNRVLSEKAFKKKYPEVIAKYEKRLKELEKESDVESWYKPKGRKASGK